MNKGVGIAWGSGVLLDGGGQSGENWDNWPADSRAPGKASSHWTHQETSTIISEWAIFTAPHCLRQSPHHCSRLWVMHRSSLATPLPTLYLTFPWLFCNYLFVLFSPLASSPIPPKPVPSGNHQNTLHIHDSVSALLICLVCFLDSIVGRYVFLAILLLIVLICFFLKKSL